jgi:hypothetical protein
MVTETSPAIPEVPDEHNASIGESKVSPEDEIDQPSLPPEAELVLAQAALTQQEMQQVHPEQVSTSLAAGIASFLAGEILRNFTKDEAAAQTLAHDLAQVVATDHLNNVVSIDALSERISALGDKCQAAGISGDDLRQLYWNATVRLADAKDD